MGPNTHRSGFSIHRFGRDYMHNWKTKGRIRPFYVSNDCSTIEDIYSLGCSCIRINIAELWVQTCITTTFQYNILCVLTRIGLSVIQHCVRILQAFIYIANWYATTPDNKIHVHYDCILHTERRLYCQLWSIL